MHVVFVLAEAVLVVVLAAVVLAILDLIGNVMMLVWGPAMLVLGGAGTLGGLGLLVWAIRQDNVWLGVGGVLGSLFFAWIFGQERQLASMSSLGQPGPP
jgi:hypothetical protein